MILHWDTVVELSESLKIMITSYSQFQKARLNFVADWHHSNADNLVRYFPYIYIYIIQKQVIPIQTI